jgi:gamma-glutamylputrescine oxidase
VAVVGGGLAGLSAALELAERGFSVTLLEARQLGWGASGRNGGQAIHGLACDQSTIEEQLGLDEARRVWAMSIEALDLLRQRITRYAIDCDWRDGYLGLATNARKGRELQDWAERMDQVYGYTQQHIPPAEMAGWIASDRYHSGVFDARSGHLHPLKYTLGLGRAAAAAGVVIHEHTPVTSLLPGETVKLHTPQGELQARHVLLAGNVYLQGIAPELEPRIMPVGTYIACTEKLDDALADSLIPSRAAVCDTNFVLDYFRTTNDQRMLYGGRVSYSTVTPMNLAESIRQRMVGTFPQLASAKVEYAWGGFVDISMNRAPDFGRLPAAKGYASNVYYLQGFSGHGLALTGLAGKLVAEALAGDASRFDTFARLKHRPFPGGRLLRTPALVLGMAWYRMRDLVA